MSKIKVFYVLNVVDGKEILLSIVPSKDCAFEYVNNYLRLDYYDHFKAWCGCHNKNFKDFDSWKVYLRDCIPSNILDGFNIKKVYLKTEEVTESLRMLCGFSPLGLSYEGTLESALLVENLPKLDVGKLQWLKNQASMNDKMSYILNMACKGEDNGEESRKTV